ncbi:MAG TPA: serine/threonine-protein kinase [Thermoanaerobaculia bacterium]|nr:serine/threonine-protein kinase [Thermoanaerobaculia bacterium]
MKSSPWIRLLLALTALKLLGGVIGFAWGELPVDPTDQTVFPPLYRCLILLAFAGVGLFLLTSEKNDERAFTLGSFFFVLSAAFANRPLLSLAKHGPEVLAWPGLILSGLPVDTFLPYCLWAFTEQFPNSVSSFKMHRLLAWGRKAAFGFGIAAFAWQAARQTAKWVQADQWNPASLVHQKASYGLYVPMMLLVMAALVVLLRRTWGASGEEGRRSRIFVAGLVAGLAPQVLEIILEMIPAYEAFVATNGRREILGWSLILPAFISVPFTTAYAVLVSHVLQVKLIARKAAQYALARTSALLLALVPLTGLVLYLVRQREQKLGDIFTGPQLPLLAAAATLGFASLAYRKRLMDSIDRHYFREQYDARQTLTLLVERSRAANSVNDLSNLLGREVDMALHPESVSLMAFEPRLNVLADPNVRGRRLDASSSLAALIASASDPLPVDLDDPRSPLAKLPEKDRFWLVDSGFRLLVPILARDGSLLGLIGLGEKKSGLPFFKDDRQLLRAIANSAAWVLELEQVRSTGSSSQGWPGKTEGTDPPPFPDPVTTGAELAKECPQCSRLYTSYTVFCTQCSRRLEPSHVPYVLPGKFRFERRIGIGGMGVVYRGTDMALGRPIAVKTLRRVSPEDAMRLRREARTAAAVSHQHLAPVYGMETWQGTPMLVMELLEGGTLAQRIEKGRLDAAETIALGIAMCDALEHLHASDILHRDIKPSNIGYTRDGTPKLMDFGIARVMFDLRRDLEGTTAADDPDEDSALPPTSLWNRPSSSVTVSKQLVGTLAYLSPEALNGEPADTSFDLWGLAIVLYECLLGRRVFSGGDIQQLMTRIRTGRVPDFSQVCPEHEELLGDFFRSALHKTIGRRPASARELKERLAAARLRLAT